jgi:hypothetical protein
MLVPIGLGAAWPGGALALLAGGPLDAALALGPRSLMAPLLLAMAEAIGWEASLALAPAPGAAAALVLMPRR